MALRSDGGAWSTKNGLISARPGGKCKNGAVYSASNKPRSTEGKRGDPDCFACPNPNCDWVARSWCIRYVTDKDFRCERKVALQQIKDGIFENDEDYEGYDDLGELDNEELKKFRGKANSMLSNVAERARRHVVDTRYPNCQGIELPLAFRKAR